MGSGKSTVGKKLAGMMGYQFIDLDSEIEVAEGEDVAAIFANKGEDYFRRTESETLRRADLSGNHIIAVGGGAPCYFDNLNYMNGTGITVYLQMSPRALASRLSPKASSSRPLLRGLEGDDLLRFIEEKLKEREAFYLRSDIVFEGIDADPVKLMEAIRAHAKCKP